MSHHDKHVLILAADGFEQSELIEPKRALEEAGIGTEIVSLKAGEIKGWKDKDWGDSVPVDKTVDEIASCEGYDALLLPGGQMNPDILRMNEKAVGIVKMFAKTGKPIAAICHAPWLLAEAGLIDGKTVTGWPSIRTDLKNAGANVVDEPAVTDGNIVTSRNPDDVPVFTEAVIALVEKATAEATA